MYGLFAAGMGHSGTGHSEATGSLPSSFGTRINGFDIVAQQWDHSFGTSKK
jgi:hypothetical protein